MGRRCWRRGEAWRELRRSRGERERRGLLRQDVATDGVREASQSYASDSPCWARAGARMARSDGEQLIDGAMRRRALVLRRHVRGHSPSAPSSGRESVSCGASNAKAFASALAASVDVYVLDTWPQRYR